MSEPNAQEKAPDCAGNARGGQKKPVVAGWTERKTGNLFRVKRRPGHSLFIGPVDPAFLDREGAITYGDHNWPEITLRLPSADEARHAQLAHRAAQEGMRARNAYPAFPAWPAFISARYVQDQKGGAA